MIHFHPTKIVIPIDFSETSMLAIKHGAFTAQLTKCDVYLLHVINTQFTSVDMFLPVVSIENKNEFERKIELKLNELAEDITKKYGVKVITTVRNGNPKQEIIDFTKEIKASLVVMGTHGYSPLEELVIGSNALRVLDDSYCPTMVMSSKSTQKGYQKILLPMDTSVNSRQKVVFAVEFAKAFSATVYAVAFLRSGEEEKVPEMNLILHQAQKIAEDHKVNFISEVVTKVDNRADETEKYSQKINADLTIIMTDQDAEFSSLFIGPYAQQLIHITKNPVIAIKPVDLGYADGSILTGTSS
ncbi:MAG: universal stress protein [Bacteroidetes bacterium]|nr:universal stress protein [Bacteroidota bacterium]